MFYVDLGAISIHVFDKDCVCTEDIEINETNIILVLNHFGTAHLEIQKSCAFLGIALCCRCYIFGVN